jgi:sortase B
VEATHPETGEIRMVLPEFKELFELNGDIVGWMSIPGTKIDYPVMQTPDDAEYYLDRNFDKKSSQRGCLFVHGDADVFAPSDNVTVFGHHMRDGSMFAQLDKYKKKSFWEANRYVYFDTLTERNTYEIVMVFRATVTGKKGFLYHEYIDFADAESFDAFLDKCHSLAMYETGVEAAYGDKLLCLSTCEYSQQDGRLVVVAKRIEN